MHCLAQKHSQAHFKPLCCWWYGQGTAMFVSLSSCIHHIFGTRHPKAKSYAVSRRRFRSTPRTKIWWSLEPRPGRQKEEGDMPSVPSASLVAARKRMGNMSKSFAACSPEVRLYQSWSVSLLVPALRRFINWACFTLFFPPFFLFFFPLFFNKAANYGGCITGKLNTIEKGVCEAEFRRLAECMKRHAAKQWEKEERRRKEKKRKERKNTITNSHRHYPYITAHNHTPAGLGSVPHTRRRTLHWYNNSLQYIFEIIKVNTIFDTKIITANWYSVLCQHLHDARALFWLPINELFRRLVCNATFFLVLHIRVAWWCSC